MPGRNRIDWGGTDKAMTRRVAAYGVAVNTALLQLGHFFSAKMEAYAKANRPWTDQTSNARQGLFGVAMEENNQVVVIVSHGVDYGVFLELAHQGNNAIIGPTLQAHYNEIMGAVRGLFR
jgi:hypothetical protein